MTFPPAPPNAGPGPGRDDGAPTRRPLPARALDTSADQPWPVRVLAGKIAGYVDKMAPVWVEGQIVELSRRPGSPTAFITLRDTDLDMSLSVTAATRILSASAAPLAEGAHVVVHAKPEYYAKRGSLQLRAGEIRAVGVGELLSRIEQLKRILAAEGLFAPERKVSLPFLPAVVGLICGRESKAEHDVVVNARARWPHVRFEIREVAVQGAGAVAQVSAAIAELDAHPAVEVVVVARGGGSVEDLLPFSNESLVRAASACRTPLVSAIGHETDCPLLDLVADYRASTPTDAAKRIVPDVAQERARVDQARARIRAAVAARLHREQAGLDSVRSRPSLAAPQVLVDARANEIAAGRDRARRAATAILDRAQDHVAALRAQVRALSPAATLDRGYAVVRGPDGAVLRAAGAVAAGAAIDVRLAVGGLAARVEEVRDDPDPGPARRPVHLRPDSMSRSGSTPTTHEVN